MELESCEKDERMLVRSRLVLRGPPSADGRGVSVLARRLAIEDPGGGRLPKAAIRWQWNCCSICRF